MALLHKDDMQIREEVHSFKEIFSFLLIIVSISNHYAVHLKRTQCCMSIISQ